MLNSGVPHLASSSSRQSDVAHVPQPVTSVETVLTRVPATLLVVPDADPGPAQSLAAALVERLLVW